MAKRVYFAFDYEDVSDFRANVVRKHNFTGGVEKAGYLDASMWEEAKKKYRFFEEADRRRIREHFGYCGFDRFGHLGAKMGKI